MTGNAWLMLQKNFFGMLLLESKLIKKSSHYWKKISKYARKSHGMLVRGFGSLIGGGGREETLRVFIF